MCPNTHTAHVSSHLNTEDIMLVVPRFDYDILEANNKSFRFGKKYLCLSQRYKVSLSTQGRSKV